MNNDRKFLAQAQRLQDILGKNYEVEWIAANHGNNGLEQIRIRCPIGNIDRDKFVLIFDFVDSRLADWGEMAEILDLPKSKKKEIAALAILANEKGFLFETVYSFDTHPELSWVADSKPEMEVVAAKIVEMVAFCQEHCKVLGKNEKEK